MLARQKKNTRIAGFVAGAAAVAGMAFAAPTAQALPAGYDPDATVVGGIAEAYNAGGNGAEIYGNPIANEAVAPTLDGAVSQSFEKDGKLYGTFYWTPEHGAHFVKAQGAIGAKHIEAGQKATMNHTLNEYGAPVSEEICDGAAVEGREPHCSQVFENATITWSESEGAVVTFN